MDAADSALALLLVAAGLIGGLFQGTVRLRRVRTIEDTPTARVRSAAQGYVEFEGRARLLPGEPIIAPLLRTPCVWWRYEVCRKETRGKRSEWVVVHSGRSDDLFLLDDGSDRCIVDADGAEVTPGERHVWYGSGPQPDLGPKAGSGWLRALFGRYRYTVELIGIGAPLYALGWFRTEGARHDPQDENGALVVLLRDWKQDAQKMTLFDANKDGRVDGREWEAVRRVALQKIRAQTLERAVNPDFHVLARPPDGRAFLLSGRSQAHIVGRLRWQSALWFALAVASAAALVPLWKMALVPV